MTISVLALNDNPPSISISNENLEYIEESGPLRIGTQSEITVTDSDHEEENILTTLTLILSSTQDGQLERIEVNASSPMFGINIIASKELYFIYMYYTHNGTCLI